MLQPPRSTMQKVSRQSQLTPLSILRTETVLSRFPIHNLTQGREVAIRIAQANAQGDINLHWTVSYNDYYGPPRHLAYKLDTIVINQILDALPRPLPRVLKVGSLRQIALLLDLNDSGQQRAHLKSAFHQNASAYIVAYLRYRGRDGTERTVNTGFTRYSVIFTGEQLPDGMQADAVYLVLSEPYREVLNHAPVRPLNYAYLKVLAPMAQRFYEIVSYKIFAALKHHHPQATLRYADYCLLSTQQRYAHAVQVQKQMYKVHRPHLDAGYLTRVAYEATTDDDGLPDWLMHYTPGPKARAAYAAFMHQPGAEAAAALTLPADADQQGLLATVTREPPAASTPLVAPAEAKEAAARPAPRPEPTPGTPHAASPEEGAHAALLDPLQAQAQTLVTAFSQRFHGLAEVTPHPKELAHATELLATYGEATAHFLLPFAHEAAGATHYQPQTFGGILHDLPRALAAYDRQATQATTQQAAATDRTWREQYAQWQQQALAQLRATQPPADFAALEATQQARLVAAGTPAFALGLAVRVAVDEALEAQAGLPAFAAWRETQGSSFADARAVPTHAGGARHAS
jgi:hypothetical protein